MNEYDCLLLEFVFGNRPDDAQKVRAYILEIIASDPGLQQTELVFLGLFGRSCRILESQDQQVSSALLSMKLSQLWMCGGHASSADCIEHDC